MSLVMQRTGDLRKSYGDYRLKAERETFFGAARGGERRLIAKKTPGGDSRQYPRASQRKILSLIKTTVYV